MQHVGPNKWNSAILLAHKGANTISKQTLWFFSVWKTVQTPEMVFIENPLHTYSSKWGICTSWVASLFSIDRVWFFVCVCVDCLEIHPLIQGHLVVVALMTGNMMQFVLSSMRVTFVTEMQCLPGFLRHKPKGKLTRNWKNSLKRTLLIRKRSSDGLLQLLSFWQSVGFLSKETMKLLDPPITGITWAPWNYWVSLIFF